MLRTGSMARTQTGTRPVGPLTLLARTALIAWLSVFAFLSVDALIRIIEVRALLGNAGEAAGLIGIEACRALTLVLAVLVIAYWYRSASRVPATGLLAALVGFSTLWYAQASAFSGFPGHFQEYMAGRLINVGVPRWLPGLLFGAPEWPLWLALGAWLRITAMWPRPLDPTRIGRSGANDRRGMLRSVAFAGSDIGAGFRKLATAAASADLLAARVVWPVVTVAGAVHSLNGGLVARLAFGTALATGVAIGITNARSILVGSTRRQRSRVLRCLAAAVVAGTAILVSSVLALGGGAPGAVVGIALASVAPIVVLAVLAPAIRRDPPDARPGLHRAVLAAATTVTGVIAYLLSLAVLPGSSSPDVPVREFISLVTSVVLLVVAAPRLRAIADRITPAPAGASSLSATS